MVVVNAFVVYVFSVYVVRSSLACNGYQLKVNHIRNCDPNSIIKVQNLNLVLNNNCEIVPSGCIVVTKQFQTAMVHYTFSKPPLPTIEGDMDACESMQNSNNADVNQGLDLFQFPKQCPVDKSKVCSDASKKITIGKYKNRLGLVAGNLTAKVDVKHNNGVSCIEISLNLQKPRRG